MEQPIHLDPLNRLSGIYDTFEPEKCHECGCELEVDEITICNQCRTLEKIQAIMRKKIRKESDKSINMIKSIFPECRMIDPEIL